MGFSYADHIKALSQRPADPAWISVSERLPGPERSPDKIGYSCWGTYIVSINAPNISDKPIVIPANWTGEWRNDGGFSLNVTHWQPLPAPPLASPVPKEKK